MNTLSTRAPTRIPLLICAVCLLLLGASMAIVRPDRPWVWLTALLALAVGASVYRHARTAQRESAQAGQLINALLLAGVVLCLALGAALLGELRLLSGTAQEQGQRTQGLIHALIVLVYANVIPKVPAAARWQAQLRFAGWALVLAALVYGLTWLFAPIAWAPLISMSALAGALLLIGARCALRSFNKAR